MFDYLAFVYGGISESSGNALDDGVTLARRCLDELNVVDNAARFPPKLLILLASPAYLDRQKAERLLSGVYETFSQIHGDIPLIGSSVGGVFFDRQIHPRGALLICLASRLIEARVACGMNARLDTHGAINDLLGALTLDSSGQTDPNPLTNRLILTFMPGCNQANDDGGFYPAPELHRMLYEGAQARITMFGGVSSAGDPSRKANGLQFAQKQVLQDSIVAASVITGVPIGVSLNDGLLNTGQILRVTKLGMDERTILELDGSSPRELLGPDGSEVMLATLSTNGERVIDIPLPVAEDSVQLLRQIKLDTYFEVLRQAPRIIETTQKGITQAKQRAFVQRPIASLLFPSIAYSLRHERDTVKMVTALAQIEKELQQRPCIGGFFDGEIGVDETGRSRITNGSIAYVIFGDEMREHTPLHKGISALTEYVPELLAASDLTQPSIYEVIDNSLNLLDKAGFPGAMISLIMANLDRGSNETRNFIIARNAVGSRFPKVVENTQHSIESFDILAIVVNKQQARFVPNSKDEPSCDLSSVERSGLISQYVLPLKTIGHTAFGTLQVDMGDLRHLSEEEFRKTEKARMLDCFAEVIGAGINRIANAVESDIMLGIDMALKESLSASSISEGIERFIAAAGKAFGVDTGSVRLVKPEDVTRFPASPTLILEAGFGACYEVEKEIQREIDANSLFPVCSAFRSDNPHIVNDVSSDPAWTAMLDSARHDSELFTALNRIKSYAAVAFVNEHGQKLGTISFATTESWYFFRFHRKALQVLAERLGFLVEHLRARIQLKLLSDVSPRLAERNLSATETILRDVTEDFRRALKADVASLYLWDQDRKRYILRAQSNWQDPRWVHASSYSKDDGWIGVAAVNQEPIYVADLYKHYVEHAYHRPSERFAKYIFGQPLSDTFTVEAIGLPLRIGPEATDTFGVLTLYCRVEKGRPGGFVTKSAELLQEAAYAVAGLINAALRRRADIVEEGEDARRQEVYRGICSGDDEDSFEVKVCREVLKAYRATEVEFYRIDETGTAMKYSWIAGCHRRAGSSTDEWGKMSDASADHSQLINETRRIVNDKLSYEVAIRRYRPPEGQESNPLAVKLDGLVEQVCIPLVGDQTYLAALVVRWTLSPKAALSLEIHHNPDQLQRLGFILGSSYIRRRITQQAMRSQLAVQTAGIYVFQHAHKLGNAIMSLYRIAQEIKSAQDDGERQSKVEELEKAATNNMKMIDWVINLGELVQNPVPERLSLRKLVQESWDEVAILGSQIDAPEFSIAEEITITADHKLMKEVFINLMNNAIKAMPSAPRPDGERPCLRVNAVVSEDKETVKIIFKDNGIGMTVEQIANAERGFVATRRQSLHIPPQKGVGVLISRYLLRVQNGSLAYSSSPGEGTEAIVTLPHWQI